MMKPSKDNPTKENFKSYGDKEAAFLLVNEFYSLGLGFFSKKLGEYHNVHTEQSYWEIILGLWLREICLLYIDRTMLLEKLNQTELKTLNKYYQESYVIPQNYKEFFMMSNSHSIESNISHSRLLLEKQEDDTENIF